MLLFKVLQLFFSIVYEFQSKKSTSKEVSVSVFRKWQGVNLSELAAFFFHLLSYAEAAGGRAEERICFPVNKCAQRGTLSMNPLE